MQVKAGSYTGNGTVDRAVTGVGFQPDLVIVKRGNTGDTAFFRTTSMASGSSMTLRADSGIVTGGIKTFNSDGFTLGTNAEVNSNLVTYYYLAVKKDTAGDFDYGTYTGNGSDNRNLTLQSTFPFTWLVIKGDGGRTGAYRNKDLAGDATHAFYFTGTATDQIQSMGTTIGDVQLGTSDFVNANSRTYYWFGFKEVAGFSTSFTYTGNGSDNRDISIPSTTFQPGFVWLKRQDSSDPRMRTSAHSGDSSQSFDGATETNSIQGFNATGFQVGTNSQVNNNTSTYHVLALKEGTSANSNVAPSALAGTLAVLAPVIVGAAAVAASLLTGTAAVRTPALAGGANIAPSAITTTLAIQAPTVVGAANVSPNALSGAFTLQAPSVSGGGTNVLPNVVTGTLAVQSPTATGGASTSPNTLNGTLAVQSPTVTGASNVSPAILSGVLSLQSPATTGAANTSPAHINAVISVQSPTVSGASTVSPNTLAGTLSVESVSATGAGRTSPSVVGGSLVVVSPTPTGAANASPTHVNASFSVQAAVASTPIIVSPATISGALAVQSPQIQAGAVITPSTLTLTALLRTPRVSGQLWTPLPKPDAITWTPPSKPATAWNPPGKPTSIWTPINKPAS
jgi:hypothetical protein